MDLNERRIDVEVDRTLPLGGRATTPHLVTYLGDAKGDGLSHLGGDLVEGPVQRRVRRHMPEQVSLGAQMLKLEEAGYVSVEKRFVARKPQTLYRMTAKGRDALVQYVAALKSILGAAL